MYSPYPKQIERIYVIDSRRFEELDGKNVPHGEDCKLGDEKSHGRSWIPEFALNFGLLAGLPVIASYGHAAKTD